MLNLRPRLVALLVFLPLSVFAQYASDSEKGFKAGYSYDTSDFEAVSVWTGNLVVNIPIITYPQRGKVPSFGLHLVYNGKSWQQVQPSKTQEASWKFTGNGVQLAYAPAYGNISGYASYEGVNYNYYQVVDAYGTLHDMGGGLNGVAMDGSGFANSRDRNGVNYGNWGAITDLDGNSVKPDLAKDSLGSTYLTGWTDTVGRFIPAPPGIQHMWRPGVNAGVGGNDGINTVCNTTSFPGEGGGTVPIKTCYSTYTATSDFQQQYVTEGTGQFTAVSSVSFPDGTSWSFEYNSWGDLQSVTLPTGGTATYQWQNVSGRVSCNCAGALPYERAIQTRTLTPTPGSSTGVITSTYDYSGSSGANTVKVTNLAGDYVIHTGNPETEVKFYDHVLGLQKTVDTTYAPSYFSPYRFVDNNYSRPALPETITTTLPSGQVAKTCIVYDNNTNTTCTGTDAYSSGGPTWTDTNPGGQTYPVVYGSELYRYEYDYGQGAPGALLRATQHVYKWQASGSPYLANNVLDAECLTTIYGPGTAVPVQTSCAAPALQSNQVAQTINGYDENNGSPQGAFGNLTSVTRWLGAGTSPKSQTIYNSQGMPWKVCQPIDTACANPTIDTYDGTGLFPSSLQQPTTGGIQHIDNFAYDADIGQVTSHTDPNGVVTKYSYADSLDRLTLVQSAVGATNWWTKASAESDTAYKYTGSTEIDVKQDLSTTGDAKLASSTVSDGLGRPFKVIARDGSVTEAGYDAVGRVCAASNPSLPANAPSTLSCTVGQNKATAATDGYTYFSYDILGRKILQTQPDGKTLQWKYTGNMVDFYDEDNSHWQRTSDALGRLTKVLENDPGGSGSLTLETDYTYDPLGNLLSVNQKGAAGDTPRYRSFVYDSLSRLTNACNPETIAASSTCTATNGPWSAIYTYDADGNVLTKTDSRAIVTHYNYDALDRLITKTYTNDPANTPALTYGYDVESAWQLTQDENNPIGHLNSIQSTLGSTTLVTWTSGDYDQRGNLTGWVTCMGGTVQGCPGFGVGGDLGYDLNEDLGGVYADAGSDL